ncbi:MAG: 4'-phosphopantetheinyl transferase superfamily protein [Planctomycetes bacterium]|nr:4'-phosphopantetheinyl transferase superfamily protein [Planctomycetota bacterium]
MPRVFVACESVALAADGPARVAEQSAAARRALARAAEHAGLDAYTLSKTARGAPRLDVAGWHVSLAHTRSLALAALAERPVGIDVEDLREGRLAKLQRYFEPDELARLGSLAPRELAALWSAKESVLKLAGVGIEELRLVVLTGRDGATFRLLHRTAPRTVVHREFDSHLVALCVDAAEYELGWLAEPARAGGPR